MTALAQYPFAEFLADWDALDDAGSLREGPLGRVLARVVAYFRDEYPDEDVCMFRYLRFMGCLQFIADHIHDLDQGDLAVYGSPRVGSMVSTTLLAAIHHHAVATTPAAFMAVTVDQVLATARHLQAEA